MKELSMGRGFLIRLRVSGCTYHSKKIGGKMKKYLFLLHYLYVLFIRGQSKMTLAMKLMFFCLFLHFCHNLSFL